MLFSTAWKHTKDRSVLGHYQSICHVKHVIELKCLGVIFDKHLNWNKLVKAIVSKAFRQVDMLSHVLISLNIVQMQFIFEFSY